MNKIMENKAITFLESHLSDTPSRFVEEVNWRKEDVSANCFPGLKT